MVLKNVKYERDFRPIDENCTCFTCKRFTRAFLHSIVNKEAVSCQLLSIHNIAYQLTLMRSMRQSIIEQRFPDFVRQFMKKMYTEQNQTIPDWAREALESVGISFEV